MAAVAFPPLRSLQDFLTDAQFTAPTLNDLERMENRMINNLIYYQTNYFLIVIVTFILVGVIHPKDLLIGSVAFAVTLIMFGVAQSHEPKLAQMKQQYPFLVPGAVFGLAVLCVYALGSILAFVSGVTVPVAVTLLHAATRKRNIKNKFANAMELFKEDVTPMTIILSRICTIEQEREEKGKR
ncbi:PRA1 family protein 3-like [Montipora capricornis]|uniref:PRA1 family protein 3-like n=1 Tax=Montipora capricornis TaxID=246305 RepID=UPI0035F126E9